MAERDNKRNGLTPAHIDRLLEIQEQEIKIRAQELELTKRQIEHSSRNSEKSIEAQLEFERMHNQAFLVTTRLKAILAGILMIALTAVMGTALVMGKEQIVIELIKLAAVGLGGAVGGFAVGWKKGRTETSKTDDLSP